MIIKTVKTAPFPPTMWKFSFVQTVWISNNRHIKCSHNIKKILRAIFIYDYLFLELFFFLSFQLSFFSDKKMKKKVFKVHRNGIIIKLCLFYIYFSYIYFLLVYFFFEWNDVTNLSTGNNFYIWFCLWINELFDYYWIFDRAIKCDLKGSELFLAETILGWGFFFLYSSLCAFFVVRNMD